MSAATAAQALTMRGERAEIRAQRPGDGRPGSYANLVIDLVSFTAHTLCNGAEGLPGVGRSCEYRRRWTVILAAALVSAFL
jgi:hypothetical protein